MSSSQTLGPTRREVLRRWRKAVLLPLVFFLTGASLLAVGLNLPDTPQQLHRIEHLDPSLLRPVEHATTSWLLVPVADGRDTRLLDLRRPALPGEVVEYWERQSDHAVEVSHFIAPGTQALGAIAMLLFLLAVGWLIGRSDRITTAGRYTTMYRNSKYFACK